MSEWDLHGIAIAQDLLSPSLISRLIAIHSLDPSLFSRLIAMRSIDRRILVDLCDFGHLRHVRNNYP